MATESMHIHADTTKLKLLAKKLADAAPAARKVAQKKIRDAAVLVEQDAASRASFSSRIPSTGKVRMAGLNVSVSFGGGDAYYAVPLENGGRGGVVHPVFGNLNGQSSTNKNSPPAFLAPALAAHTAEFIDVLTEAVATAIGEMLDI